jgi:sporulation protein YlmC with PRC-barrel domain
VPETVMLPEPEIVSSVEKILFSTDKADVLPLHLRLILDVIKGSTEPETLIIPLETVSSVGESILILGSRDMLFWIKPTFMLKSLGSTTGFRFK